MHNAHKCRLCLKLHTQCCYKDVERLVLGWVSKHVFERTDIIRIYAEPFAHNIASCRAPEKAGFQYEGTLKSNAVKCGRIVDMKMYALVRE